jgi:hypothetical protein
MMTIRNLLRELLGLFVDDGSLALALLAWLGAAAAISWQTDYDGLIKGGVLFGGSAAILIENVLRRARESGSSGRERRQLRFRR